MKILRTCLHVLEVNSSGVSVLLDALIVVGIGYGLFRQHQQGKQNVSIITGNEELKQTLQAVLDNQGVAATAITNLAGDVTTLLAKNEDLVARLEQGGTEDPEILDLARQLLTGQQNLATAAQAAADILPDAPTQTPTEEPTPTPDAPETPVETPETLQTPEIPAEA